MPDSLRDGVYDDLLTRRLRRAVAALHLRGVSERRVTDDEAPQLLARAVGAEIQRVLEEIRGEADGRVIYHINSPITKTGGVVSLRGNLAPDGAIVKVAGMTEAEQVFTGPARVFECEEDAFAAVKAREYKEGEVIESHEVPELSREQIVAAFDTMKGDFYQMPPMVSAIKKDGVPLYKLARQGKTTCASPVTTSG